MRERTAAWAVACALALAVVAQGGESKGTGQGKKARGKQSEAGPLGAPATFTVTGVREPSGVAWHPRLSRLFVVGDDGTLAEMDAAGKTLHTTTIGGNLEDVTVHGPSGLLILLGEARAELIAWDPAARRETGRWALDTAALLGRPAADKRQGFEGLFFQAGGDHPGGGVFYLVHQRGPAAIVAVAFDPTRPGGPLGQAALMGRWPAPRADDLTAITYVPALDLMLVIAEASDRLLGFRADGSPAGELPLPGMQQEGLAVDGDGRLWVADDRAGTVMRFEVPPAPAR
jgi:uncharacterized protein YjiK